MNEDKVRQIVKEETAHLATKKEMREGFDKLDKKLTNKIDGVVFVLGERIDKLEESNLVIIEKMDALIGTTEKFIVKIEKEEQERKFGQKQLERRVEKLEAKA